MGQITNFQELHAARLAEAMTHVFDVDYGGFAIVQGIPDSECPPTVAYVARLGIYLGDWNEIRGSKRSPVPEENFIVMVGEEKFDTRQGMTEAVYRVMVAQDPNSHAPDKPLERIRGGTHFPMTWLTGESAKPHWAPVGQVDITERQFKRVNRIGIRRNTDNDVRFRPAITLPLVR